MKVPYGLADFRRLIQEEYLYVDRTAHIRTLEEMGSALLLIRPRRFGKSLWLQTLRCYYDVLLESEHDALFGHLDIGKNPTPLAHRYFVMQWNFSAIHPQETSSNGAVGDIRGRINSYLRGVLEGFLADYAEYLPAMEVAEDPIETLTPLLAAIRRSPYRLYLLIDEYDNFANEIMFADTDAYGDLVHADSPFRALFKWVKLATEGQGLDRLFLTGVSPVVMSDITSGLNMMQSVYLYPEVNTLFGFVEGEMQELLATLHREQSAQCEVLWDVDEALEMVRSWYNGYRFAPEADTAVYNPTLALYFLMTLQRTGKYPRVMLDSNLATDEGKLQYLAQAAVGQQVIVDLIQTGRPVEIDHVAEHFALREMLRPAEQDVTFLASLLYFFGMLTFEGITEFRTQLLGPPNLVVRKLYLEQLRGFLLPDGVDRSAAVDPVRGFFRGESIDPLLDLIEGKIFTAFSNRDYRWMRELTVKMAFAALLFDEVNYTMHSEAELERGFADLCLIRRQDA